MCKKKDFANFDILDDMSTVGDIVEISSNNALRTFFI